MRLIAQAVLLSTTGWVASVGAHETSDAAASIPSRSVLIGLLIAATGIYSAGLLRARLSKPDRWPVAAWRIGAFIAAIAVLSIALASPLNALAEAYFAAHMGQHLLLVMVAAPLLAASDPHRVVLQLAAPADRRQLALVWSRLPKIAPLARVPVAAMLAIGAFAAALALWHLPAAYDWALGNPWAHALEHSVLMATAIAFWRVIVTSGRRRMSPGLAGILVALIGIQGAFIGTIIAFAPQPLYSAYAGNPMSDQALAGVMMCVPASLVYVASTVWALKRMVRSPSRRTRSRISPMAHAESPSVQKHLRS